MLVRGVLPYHKAIDYAVQIAHGLSAAHGKDIAHRDLKPGNIFITREGRVAFSGRPQTGLTQKTAKGLAAEGETFDLAKFLAEVVIVEAGIGGAGQANDGFAYPGGQTTGARSPTPGHP